MVMAHAKQTHLAPLTNEEMNGKPSASSLPVFLLRVNVEWVQ